MVTMPSVLFFLPDPLSIFLFFALCYRTAYSLLWLHVGFGQWEKLAGDSWREKSDIKVFVPSPQIHTFSTNRLSVATALLQ